jgi:hypothetical protein
MALVVHACDKRRILSSVNLAANASNSCLTTSWHVPSLSHNCAGMSGQQPAYLEPVCFSVDWHHPNHRWKPQGTTSQDSVRNNRNHRECSSSRDPLTYLSAYLQRYLVSTGFKFENTCQHAVQLWRDTQCICFLVPTPVCPLNAVCPLTFGMALRWLQQKWFMHRCSSGTISAGMPKARGDFRNVPSPSASIPPTWIPRSTEQPVGYMIPSSCTSQ